MKHRGQCREKLIIENWSNHKAAIIQPLFPFKPLYCQGTIDVCRQVPTEEFLDHGKMAIQAMIIIMITDVFSCACFPLCINQYCQSQLSLNTGHHS